MEINIKINEISFFSPEDFTGLILSEEHISIPFSFFWI